MKKTDRREFLRAGGVAAAGLISGMPGVVHAVLTSNPKADRKAIATMTKELMLLLGKQRKLT